MNLEIERKFRATHIPAEALQKATDSLPILQGYLCTSDGAEVRIRKKGDKAFLTVKKGKGIRRQELEILITEEQFESLWPATLGQRVEKVRHELPVNDRLTAEVDVFAGENEGLVLVEIEFPDEETAHAFKAPDWFGIDVTSDAAYKNASLAK